MKSLYSLALSIFAAFIFSTEASPQIRGISFGDIPREDIEMVEYAEDPAADAVILDDYVRVEMSITANIMVNVERHVRIKIINTDGLDYANVEIPYGYDENVSGIKAASYNLEDGETVASLVERKGFYYEKTSSYWNTLRFSIPNVRAGTVIEYRYTIASPDYYTLYTLEFQHDIPLRRCNFEVRIPGYFSYKFVPSGDLSAIRQSWTREWVAFIGGSEMGSVGKLTGYDIPAYRDEPFSTGSDDYYMRMGFELSKIEIPGVFIEDVSPSYPKLSEKLLERTDFGKYISDGAKLRQKVAELKDKGGSQTDLLRRIYTFVAEHMMWDGYSDYTASGTIRKIYNDARGNAADINLMLIAMIREAGLSADPVILSTRKHGIVNPLFAIIQRFNHVAAIAKADGKDYIMDATDPLRPFNVLPKECLNGEGWVVTPSGGYWVNITNGEHSSESVSFEMALDNNGILTGTAVNKYESFDAWAVRKVCRLEGLESYTDLMRYYYSNLKIENLELENLDQLEEPVTERIKLTVPDASVVRNNTMYLSPFFYNRDETNEFYAENRISPIDLACPSDSKYSCTITIPDGWSVEELPQSVNILMAGGGARFRYDIKAEGRKILFDMEVEYSTFTYPPDRYNSLRNFQSDIIRKKAELVILRKVI